MRMDTGDLNQPKQVALDKVIFHMTPQQWITESGPVLTVTAPDCSKTPVRGVETAPAKR